MAVVADMVAERLIRRDVHHAIVRLVEESPKVVGFHPQDAEIAFVCIEWTSVGLFTMRYAIQVPGTEGPFTTDAMWGVRPWRVVEFEGVRLEPLRLR